MRRRPVPGRRAARERPLHPDRPPGQILSSLSEHQQGRLYVALAAVAWSTAGILQRELHVGTATQLAGRALFAVVGLLAFIAVSERGRGVRRAFRAIGRAGLAVAALMALSSGFFIVALNHASVASVLFMQAFAPLLAAVFGLALGEPVSRRTWTAMLVAVAGVALMVGGPGRPGAVGLVLSFGMTAAFAGLLVITRHQRQVSMAPATCLSQVVVLVAAAGFTHPGAVGGSDLGLLAALGVGQIGLGLVFLSIGGRLIPAAEVALITLLEVVLGPLWVWVFLAERPGAGVLAGGAIVLAAVALQATARRPDEQPAPVI
ncbi:MAG TPA: DMT family transporter [Gaiellaceae bacterium]|nr:DMT family transporter [Gaiellaceae bacterium]